MIKYIHDEHVWLFQPFIKMAFGVLEVDSNIVYQGE
jgi:hypothetical protein